MIRRLYPQVALGWIQRVTNQLHANSNYKQLAYGVFLHTPH